MKKSQLRQLIREEIQKEIFGFGKHPFEKLKYSRDGFTANVFGDNLSFNNCFAILFLFTFFK